MDTLEPYYLSNNVRAIILIPYHIFWGLYYKIPICCIFRFCFDCLTTKASGLLRWEQSRTEKCFNDYHVNYIPCLWKHSYVDAGITFINSND